MSSTAKYPAVWAGLAGALGAGLPHTALATTAEAGLEGLASGIVLPLFFGSLVGAGVVGIAALVTYQDDGYDDDDDFVWQELEHETRANLPIVGMHTQDSAITQGVMSSLEMPVITVARQPVASAAPQQIPPATSAQPFAARVPMIGDSAPMPAVAQARVDNAEMLRQSATRMRGVAAVLSERLSGDPLGEGVSLSRSVASSAPAFRWEGARAPRAAQVPPARVQSPQATWSAQPASGMPIAERIARVDVLDPFDVPDVTVEDSRDDLWRSALMALDERVIEQPLSFSDAVGSSDTLDEPDGLEVDTDFIPFRVPAGHPEVVDAESYVDHLVRQEFETYAARNSARRVPAHAPRSLRLVDSSTGVVVSKVAAPEPRRLILSPAERKLAYRPRHMKPEFMAQEA